MNYNELSKAAHKIAVNHGFWNKKSNEHYMMLVVVEIGETVEAHRNRRYADIKAFEQGTLPCVVNFERFIKDTIEDEMADIAIWLADIAGALGINFDKMNPCRYHRAFDKFSFTENAFALTKGLCRDTIAIEKRIQFGMEYVFKWAKELKIDLPYFINLKMKYNANRPLKNGKAY